MNFIDTNLIVYANDQRDPNKQEKALDLIRREIRERTGVISIQVMQEYANTALYKLGQSTAIVLRQLSLLESRRQKGSEYQEKKWVFFKSRDLGKHGLPSRN